jgi:hypothetical protein
MGASYVSPSAKPLAPIHPAFGGIHRSLERNVNADNGKPVEEKQNTNYRKGGRPRKPDKRDQQLAVMCTPSERREIESKAENLCISVSHYLREAGLRTEVVMHIRQLPKEILLLTGTLNHAAANLNQIARKRNQNDELNALERAQLQSLRTELSRIATTIKQYFK